MTQALVKPSPKRRRRADVSRREAVATHAVAYLRVSTDEQVQSGAGLEAQRAAITAYSAARDWTLLAVEVDEGVSGAVAPNDRLGLQAALIRLESFEAGVLVVAKPDRLARTLSALLGLRDRATAQGWALAAADGSVDLTTPHGRAMFSTLGTFAELERDLIATRTREALAVKRAQGVRLGRPSALPAEVRARVLADREAALSLRAIAAALNAEGVSTPTGRGIWTPPTVARAVRTAQLDREAAAARPEHRSCDEPVVARRHDG